MFIFFSHTIIASVGFSPSILRSPPVSLYGRLPTSYSITCSPTPSSTPSPSATPTQHTDEARRNPTHSGRADQEKTSFLSSFVCSNSLVSFWDTLQSKWTFDRIHSKESISWSCFLSSLPATHGDTCTTWSGLAWGSTQSCHERSVGGGATRPVATGVGTQPQVLATPGVLTCV